MDLGGKVKTLLDLHNAVLEHLQKNVTFVYHNPNDYILVRNNYLPLEDINSLIGGMGDGTDPYLRAQFL